MEGLPKDSFARLDPHILSTPRAGDHITNFKTIDILELTVLKRPKAKLELLNKQPKVL